MRYPKKCYLCGMRFSKENQPSNRRSVPEKRIVMSVRVRPSTRQWLKDHRKTGGDVIEEYVKDKENNL